MVGYWSFKLIQEIVCCFLASDSFPFSVVKFPKFESKPLIRLSNAWTQLASSAVSVAVCTFLDRFCGAGSFLCEACWLGITVFSLIVFSWLGFKLSLFLSLFLCYLSFSFLFLFLSLSLFFSTVLFVRMWFTCRSQQFCQTPYVMPMPERFALIAKCSRLDMRHHKCVTLLFFGLTPLGE
jgi:hypothetical protein